MESRPIVRIYESRLWRRSRVAKAAMGIAFEEELERVSKAAQLDDAQRVLDLACGSGIYSRPFARALPPQPGSPLQTRVVGLDISRPMLAYAEEARRREGLDQLRLVRGSALHLPFRSGIFDVVNCCGALHLFPEVPRVLEEVHRVLAAGGRFTAAVIRVGPSPRDRFGASMRRRLLGVESFRAEGLEEQLGAAGLGDFRVLHEQGLWLVAVARKTSADSALEGNS